MNKLLKIVLGLAVFLVIILGGLFFYVSTKINPEEIKKITIEMISKSLPGASVDIKNVDYSIGASIKVAVSNIDLSLKNKKSKLFNVDKINIKIPILSILTGGGTVDLSIDGPNTYFTEISKTKNNWVMALPQDKTPKKALQESKDSSKSSFELPKFVENSKVTVRINDLNFYYGPFQKNESHIKVNKIILKNINLQSSTAFEVVSAINYSLDKDKKFQTNLKVVGEVDVGQFLREQTIKAKILADLENLKLSGLPVKIPNLENKIDVFIDKDGKIDSKINIKASNLLEASTKVSLGKSELILSELSTVINLKNLNSYLDESLKSSLKVVDLSQSSVEINGSAKVNLVKLAINPRLNIQIKDAISLSVVKDIPIQAKLNASIVNNKINVKVINELLSGIVTSEVNTKLDLLNISSDLKKLNPIDVKILATNLKVSKAFIQSNFYKNNVKKSQVTSNAKVIKQPAKKIILPKVNISLDGKNIFIEDKEVSFNSKIYSYNDEIVSKNFNIKLGKGLVTLPFKVKLKDSQNIFSNINITLKNINFESFNAVLPPFVSNVSGNFNGNVKGDINLLSEGLKYSLLVDLKATNGEVKDFKLKELVTGMFDGIKDKFPKKAEVVTNRFKQLIVKVDANENLNKINTFKFTGDKNSFDLNLNGKLYMIPKESVLTGKLVEEKTKQELKSQTGFDYYPIKFSGKGMMLINPHPEYTIQKLAGGMAKKQAKKVIKKETKKLEDKAKKEIKKLFKGIKF